MAQIRNDSTRTAAPKPLDDKYFYNLRPYQNKGEVFGNIVLDERHIGLTVNINNDEYWFRTATASPEDLVLKIGDGGSGLIKSINGLTDVDGEVRLGGVLTGDTMISGGYDLLLGVVDNKLKNLNINTSNSLNIDTKSGLISTSDNTGLQYASDYSLSFEPNSLISKLYADGIASGLFPLSSVLVATTSGITLGGLQTIDGVALVEGDRVLVKDQSNEIENGIYDVPSGGTWYRSADFSGTTLGDINRGALIPVNAGDVNKGTSWILTTVDPIIGTSGLTFSEFSKLMNISGGDGINIEQIGLNNEISVDLADNGGLKIYGSKLSVDNEIAGNGLSWNLGKINVNAVSGDSVNDVSVKYNSVNDLFIDVDEVDVVLGGVITGATNGIVKTGKTIKLGSELNENTTIPGNSHKFTLTGLTELNLGGDTVGIEGIVSLKTEPSAGAVGIDGSGDGVLVWNSTDKKVKQIPQADLGEKNNSSKIKIVEAISYTIEPDDYIILCKHADGLTLNLPSNPVDGQTYKIKDVLGIAFNNPIQVTGTVDIDGQTSVYINTNYGALEIVYSGELINWYTLGFIN